MNQAYKVNVGSIMSGAEPGESGGNQQVVVAYPEYTLRDAQDLFMQFDLHHLPVCRSNADMTVIGIVSATDVMKAYAKNDNLDATSVHLADVMTHNPTCIREDMSIAEATKILAYARFQSLPVVDGKGHIQGIITTRDVVRFADEIWGERPSSRAPRMPFTGS